MRKGREEEEIGVLVSVWFGVGERKGMRRRKSERECVVMCCVCEIGNRVLFLDDLCLFSHTLQKCNINETHDYNIL